MRVSPSWQQSTIARIAGYDGDRESASPGDSTTLVLNDEIDVSRGDVIAAADEPTEVADRFQAKLLWMNDDPLIAGRPHYLKIHTKQVGAVITEIKYRLDVNTGAHLVTPTLQPNDIGVVNMRQINRWRLSVTTGALLSAHSSLSTDSPM